MTTTTNSSFCFSAAVTTALRAVRLIVTHPGGAPIQGQPGRTTGSGGHFDELSGVALLLDACDRVGNTAVAVERRMPTLAEAADVTVAKVDVGGVWAPAMMAFDHHQAEFAWQLVDAASLVANWLYGPANGLASRDWWLFQAALDNCGPTASASLAGIETADLIGLQSPILGRLVREFASHVSSVTWPLWFDRWLAVAGAALSAIATSTDPSGVEDNRLGHWKEVGAATCALRSRLDKAGAPMEYCSANWLHLQCDQRDGMFCGLYCFEPASVARRAAVNAALPTIENRLGSLQLLQESWANDESLAVWLDGVAAELIAAEAAAREILEKLDGRPEDGGARVDWLWNGLRAVTHGLPTGPAMVERWLAEFEGEAAFPAGPVAVSIVPSDRAGEGWVVFRFGDHPRVDCRRLAGKPGVLFTHPGGFIAKLAPMTQAEAWMLARAAVDTFASAPKGIDDCSEHTLPALERL